MSIVQNLKLLNKPIAELAMLPQETIMTMAQSGQIPVAFVAPILAQKAEQAEAGANAAAMAAQEQMPAATVLEEIIARNAATEAVDSMPAENVGIGSLSVPDNSLPNEFAGGGIVAFAAGDLVKAPNPAMDRILRTLTDEERQLYDQTGQLPPGARSMLAAQQTTINPTFESIIAQAERGEGPNVSRPKSIERMPRGLTQEDVPFQPVEEEEEVVEEDYQPANLRGIDTSSILQQAEGIASALRPRGERGVPSIQDASAQTSELLAASGYDPTIFEGLRQDVAKQRESLKGDRSEAINMRLIEAGLAIMGGSSPYAFENIGKGATGAVKGLAQDFKDLRKSERDLLQAEQNLRLKQNDAALGKANITQSTIDKAQARVDKERDDYNRTKADFAKTMLSGEIQERLARSTYSTKMTDFDKQWALYSKDAKARGDTPTLDGFRRALEGSRSAVTDKDATRMAAEALKNSGLDLTTPEGRAQFEELKRYFMQQGGASRPSAGGTPPPLPSGFVLQQ
jgi:hypothetical protein